MFTIMFPVMSDYAKLTESEIQELNDHCDALREEAIAAQEAEIADNACWCKFYEDCSSCMGK